MLDLSKGFWLGPWEVRPQEGRIIKGPIEKHLEPKQMTLLVLLAENVGEVVSKEAVLAQVWPDTHVSGSGLTRNMSQLRKALGDPSRNPEFIATIPKRGYQLIMQPHFESDQRELSGKEDASISLGDINPERMEPPLSKPRPTATADQYGLTKEGPKRWYVPFVFLFGVLITVAFFSMRDSSTAEMTEADDAFETLAVLPFVNRSQSADMQFFADGLTEELIGLLGSLDGFKVVARTSSFAFRNKDLDVRAIGEALQVGKILEGSVVRESGILRVTVRLIDTQSGFQEWSQIFERQEKDMFEVQREIAKIVGMKMSPMMDQQWPDWPARTESVAAYDQYLMGQFWCRTGKMANYPDAIKCFEKAVAVDPQFARAYASMARAWTLLGQSGLASGRDWMTKAENAANQALALDEAQDEALGALGMVAMFRDQDWQAAEKALQKAIAVNPRNPLIRIWYAQILRSSGRFNAAVAQTELSIECDPLNPFVYFYATPNFMSAGKLNQAEASLEKVLRVFPKFEAAHLLNVQLAAYRNDWQKALQTCQSLDPQEGRLMGPLAQIYAELGVRGRAENLQEKLIEARKQGKPCSAFELAVVQAALNRPEEAITWLELAAEEKEPEFILEFASHPGLESLRENPRMTRLHSSMGLPVAQEAL